MAGSGSIRLAATAVLLRQGRGGLETLLLRRHSRLAFAGGAWVFPGGAVDPGDERGDGEEAAARRAAVRETREETGLEIAPEALQPFAHWTTPEQSPKRYATWFFIGIAGAGADEVEVDGGEIDRHQWYAPAQALRDVAERRIELMPPTFITLTELAACASPQAALDSYRGREIVQIHPRIRLEDNGACMLYPGDVAYEGGDLDAPGPRHRCWMLDSGLSFQRHGC